MSNNADMDGTKTPVAEGKVDGLLSWLPEQKIVATDGTTYYVAQFTPDMSEELFATAQDADIDTFTLLPKFTQVDQATQWLVTASQAPGLYAIATADGTLAGKIGIVVPDQGPVEAHYWVCPPFQGNGVAKAALALVTEAVHKHLGEPVFLEILEGNHASEHVASASGFTFSHTETSDGETISVWTSAP